MKNSISKINWWNISITVMLAALGVGKALSISQDARAYGAKSNNSAAYLAPFKNEAEAVEKGETIGVGSARLEGDKGWVHVNRGGIWAEAGLVVRGENRAEREPSLRIHKPPW